MTARPMIADPRRPTTAEWEELICFWLQTRLPVRSRWVQEHPKRDEVMRELVEEASEMLEQVNDPTEDTENPVFWASIPIAERPDEVVAVMIDQVDLWIGIDSCWPNPSPTRGSAAAATAARHDPGFRPDPSGLVPHGLTDRARRNLAALDLLDAARGS